MKSPLDMLKGGNPPHCITRLLLTDSKHALDVLTMPVRTKKNQEEEETVPIYSEQSNLNV